MQDHGIFPYSYDQHDFANGLRLITVPAPFPNVVSFYVVVSAGSRNEVEPGKSGFAHFFEHMMFRGTPEYPPERYEAVMQECGASSNAYTADDRTVYHTTAGREDFETIVAMESDRFRNLEYRLEAFQTEALAVLGEYNKDSADPVNKLFEVLRDTAFDIHPYKHTTMGFLKDIQDMPNQFDYSRLFFDRFYRPEYTTLIVAGDISAQESRDVVDRHWSLWRRGGYSVDVPAEPAATGQRSAHIPWSTPTPPYYLVGYRAAAYSDVVHDAAALDLIRFLGFSESSPLYERLMIEQQSVDILWGHNPGHLDPYLFTVLARVKQAADLPDVRRQILETVDWFAQEEVDEEKFSGVKSHLRYRFALSLNNAEAIASSVADYVALRRTPETLNRLYAIYDALTPGDLREVAGRYLAAAGRTEVTLSR